MATPASDQRLVAELRPPLSPQGAVAEARRCLYCHDAPCSRACPAGIDVAEFIRKISTGNMVGSARTLLSANVLAASCARVCPVEELCQGRCVLPQNGGAPIAIGLLQRHVMDWAIDHDLAPLQPGEERPGRVAVVGAGPAGLACAAELRRLGHRVTVFDARSQPGGLNTFAIADHKISPRFAADEARWLAGGCGFELSLGRAVGSAPTLAELEQDFDAVFLGLGLGTTMDLALTGEELPGVVDAMELIEASRAGDALPVDLAGKVVTVVGGGNTAVDAAILALRRGAKTSTIVYRRSEAEMPAYRAELALAHSMGVGFVMLHGPVAIEGDGAVSALRCQPMRLGEPDESGRRRPEPSGEPELSIPCEVVITALGRGVSPELVDAIAGLERSGRTIEVDPQSGQTGNPRFFAGGDCVNGGREVVNAVAEGKRAAQGIHAYLTAEERNGG